MRRVAIILFELGVVKNFMITYLFKNCAWLQQFYMEIESFMWCAFNEKYCKKKKKDINGLASSFSNSYNIREPSLLNNHTPVKKDLMRIILFRTYEHLKLYIILCIFCVPISLDIHQSKHSFPNKFKSLLSKLSKCFWYNANNKAVWS